MSTAERDGKPRVELHEAVGLGLIVEYPSGVIYMNQTGGTFCLQSRLEVVYVPLRNDATLPEHTLLSPENELFAYFQGPPHEGTGATDGLLPQDVGFIQSVLEKWRLAGPLEIDRSRLGESHEAWVFVFVNRGSDGFWDFGPYPRTGVLTWTNTD